MLLAVASDIARNLAATGRVADMNGVFQAKMLDDGGRVVGIMIHVVAFGNLRRAAMAPAVMRNHPVSLGQEVQHLDIPVVRRKRPAVMEGNRLGILGAPVLVENIDAIFGSD